MLGCKGLWCAVGGRCVGAAVARNRVLINGRPLPLPLGEVAERSEDGEGRNVKKTCRVDTLRKYASGIFLVSISAAMPL